MFYGYDKYFLLQLLQKSSLLMTNLNQFISDEKVCKFKDVPSSQKNR